MLGKHIALLSYAAGTSFNGFGTNQVGLSGWLQEVDFVAHLYLQADTFTELDGDYRWEWVSIAVSMFVVSMGVGFGRGERVAGLGAGRGFEGVGAGARMSDCGV